MDKYNYTPLEMVRISIQHAHCARHLQKNNAEIEIKNKQYSNTFLPTCSLMYIAFELIFKAFLWQEQRPIKQYKNLQELVDMHSKLGFSNKEQQLLKNLSQQLAFHKGVNNAPWKNHSEQQIFCIDLLKLYDRIHDLTPLELHEDYHKP